MDALFSFPTAVAQAYNPCLNRPVALEAVMTRMVGLWRCKCGTRAKVVAEAGSSRSAEQMALCPKCRAPHAVHADKIISVTEETFERRPAAAPCEEKERLLVAKNKAFDLYTRRASELAGAATTIAHAEFEFLANRVSAAKQFWLDTRQRLNEHTAKHGC